MKSKFIIECFDLKKGTWIPLMEYTNRKVAIFKFNQVKKVFPKVKYRLYEKTFLVFK